MTIPTTYGTGTASVNANATAVTGQGTSWLTSGIEAGDLFWAAGFLVRIAAVVSNTSLTLAFPWPGASRTTDTYEIQFTPDATRILAASRQLLDQLTNGNISSLGGLTTAVDKLAYYTGSGVAALTTLTAFARTFLDDADYTTVLATLHAIEQAGGTGMATNKLRLGYASDGSGILAQVDAVAFGKVWTDNISTSGAGWIKLPNKMIIQQGNPVVTLNSSGDSLIYLPTAFVAASYAAVVCNGDTTVDVNVGIPVASGYPNTTSFAVHGRSSAGAPVSGNVRMNFLAIGF